MAEPAATQDVVKILDKIKAEIMQRKQLRAQNETNKQLDKMNKNLSKLEASSKQDTSKQDTKGAKPFEFNFPTVAEIVSGFARMSPIFTRDYSNWMKDTVDVGLDGNVELERIASKIEKLGSITKSPADDTSAEYLDLISDQMKAANDDSLKRLDTQGDTLSSIDGGLSRLLGTVGEINDGVTQLNKTERGSLMRLVGIEDKLGRVGGHIVGALKRIYDGDEKWREKDEMRRAEEDKETGGNPRAGSVTPTDPTPDNNSSGIGAAIAAMLGLNALKGFLLAPFKAVGAVLGKFFGLFGRLGAGIAGMLGPFGKVLKFLKVGPLALVSAIWDFGKGFVNAKDILGQAKVTVVDRVRAGLTELVGGFGDLFDWVSKVFGFDTEAGKSIRGFMLAITQKPAEWLNGIVDWISNDLFAGIGRGTSLTDIPGKLADNLQTELIKLVDWITGGVSSFIDEGIGVASKILEDIKKGFADNVKKPFYNMLNAITGAMFDIVDKFVEIIPDALGGQAAKQKMAEARQSMMIGDGEIPTTPAPVVNNQQGTQTEPSTLTPVPSSPAQANVQPETKTDQMKNAYGSIGGGSLGAGAPSQGIAVSNIEQMKSAYAQAPTSVVMPVQQNVNNARQVNNTTNLNSSSLEPTNRTDNARLLWVW